MNDEVTMEWLMDDTIQSDSGVSLAKMTLAVGATSECHSHSNCTETIHLISGTVEQLCGDKWIHLEAGDTCLIPQNYVHKSRNIGDKSAIMMLAYSSGSRVYEVCDY